MARLSGNQAAGASLIAGGLLFGIGGLLHPAQPADLASFGGTNPTVWLLSHWMIVGASVLLGAGLVGLALQIAGGGAEGVALVAGTTAVIAATGVVSVVAPEAVGFPMLLEASRAAETAAAAGPAFLALTANMSGLASVFGILMWLSIGVLYYGTLGDERWPRWVGYGGIGVALVVLAVPLLVPSPVLGMATTVLGSVWLVMTGAFLRRMPATRPPFLRAPQEIRRPVEQGQPV